LVCDQYPINFLKKVLKTFLLNCDISEA